jgi:hypothetical protein
MAKIFMAKEKMYIYENIAIVLKDAKEGYTSYLVSVIKRICDEIL